MSGEMFANSLSSLLSLKIHHQIEFLFQFVAHINFSIPEYLFKLSQMCKQIILKERDKTSCVIIR